MWFEIPQYYLYQNQTADDDSALKFLRINFSLSLPEKELIDEIIDSTNETVIGNTTATATANTATTDRAVTSNQGIYGVCHKTIFWGL